MTARKNRGIRNWRSRALFGSLVLMMVGAAVSRGALSVSVILFVCLALLHSSFFQNLKVVAAKPFLWCLSLLFFIPAVSGLWSSDLSKWSDVVRIKLPLLFFPLAFAGDWLLSGKQWRRLAYVFLLLLFCGCVWGLLHYAQNTAAFHEGYLRAKTIRTPLEDDHVRFGWLVSVAVMVCLLLMETDQRRTQRVLFFVLALFFIIYLHVLSARTGVLSLYLFLFIYAVHFASHAKNRVGPVLLLSALIVLPLLAYITLPTFKARLRYNLYDLSFAKKAQYLPGSSDGARTMSLRAGWQVLKENPLGVGAGDVMQEASRWYAFNVPQVLPADKFYPSSEWLMYGAFAGWPGLIIFTVVMLVPFFVKTTSHRIFWIGFHATAAFSFMFDMGLEVQYGVFFYGFIACGLWKALCVNRQASIVN